MNNRTSRLAVGATVALSVLAAGCGNGDGDDAAAPSPAATSEAATSRAATSEAATSPTATSAAATSATSAAATSADAAAGGTELAMRVPEAVKADGKIVVGTDSTYAPSEFLDEDGKTIIGFDVDLFKAVAAKLGLEAEFQTAPFDSIIPGVESGKYEVGVSSFTINDERKKVANMVSYFEAGTQWSVKKGNPQTVSVEDACGKKVAVQKDTVQVDDLTARSKACTDGGKKAITIDQYDGQDEATAAVVSGKDDAVLADSPVMAYAVEKSEGQLELLGEIYDSAPYGYVVKKDQTEMADALAAALMATIADGSYKTSLAKWGVEAGGIDAPAVNP